MFFVFLWFFLFLVLLFYVVCLYVYYLCVMVVLLVGERDTFVGELVKIRTRGVALNRLYFEYIRVMYEYSVESSGVDDDLLLVGKMLLFDWKCFCSVSDIGKDGVETL